MVNDLETFLHLTPLRLQWLHVFLYPFPSSGFDVQAWYLPDLPRQDVPAGVLHIFQSQLFDLIHVAKGAPVKPDGYVLQTAVLAQSVSHLFHALIV